MKERPILFSGSMVRAILNGTKTVTRRVIPPPQWERVVQRDKPCWRAIHSGRTHATVWDTGTWHTWDRNGNGGENWRETSVELAKTMAWESALRQGFVRCPFGGPGDRLWVRETWRVVPSEEHDFAVEYAAGGNLQHWRDGELRCEHLWRDLYDRAGSPNPTTPRWRPSIHMPCAFSRFTLEVVNVKVERLQEISEDDARAEGLACITKDDGRTWKYGIPDRDGLPGTDNCGWPWSEWETDSRKAFRRAWDEINGKRPGCSWKDNPYTWRIEFRRLETP